MFCLDKFSLVVVTRCNLRCRLCDEFIPQNKPFPDLTPDEACRILNALFEVVDHVKLLHLSGGGEPFLNQHLPELIDLCFEYGDKFDRLMTFTNSTILPKQELLEALERYGNKIIVSCSNYGLNLECAKEVYQKLEERGIPKRITKYYGEDQDYGGWVDFGPWDARGRASEELHKVFHNCGVTKFLHGNWRTRDGKCHWCQRSQRGMELGLLPDCSEDYVDLFGDESAEEKREHFKRIMEAHYLSACDHCSGDHGTEDVTKRFPAGEQIKIRMF
ncbi:MAG: radical SAM protein [Acidaminococcaceae bacterium]|nr:radical SAM protein [Acidaminococcaceae bacterium]